MTPLEIVRDAAATTAKAHRDEGRTVLADQINEAIDALPQPQAITVEVTDEMVELAIAARVPGGAEVKDWFYNHTPKHKRTMREVMRAALEAALCGVDRRTTEW